MLVNVSFWEILPYAPGPYPHLLLYEAFLLKQKTKTAFAWVRDLLTHLFFLKCETDILCDGLWNKLPVWQPD